MKLDALTVWYEKQAPRDQRILRYGALVVGAILLVWILLPLQRNLAQAREQLSQQQRDLDWMRQQQSALMAAGPAMPAAAPGNRESLAVVIDRSARESGLGKAYSSSQATGNGSMRVQFTSADFNLLLGLLHRLSTQQGLRIEDASITSTGNPGVVNATVQLRPGA
jgi:type II secretory pathway component PulM